MNAIWVADFLSAYKNLSQGDNICTPSHAIDHAIEREESQKQ